MCYRLSNSMSMPSSCLYLEDEVLAVDSGLRDNYPTFNRHLMVKMNSQYLRDFCEKIFWVGTHAYSIWEKSRNKIGRRTEIKKEILSIDSEEVIPQSHVSFCRLMQRYRRKTKPGRG